MLDMAKTRKTPDDAPEPPKKPARTGEPLFVYLEPALRRAIDALAEQNRRTLTAEVSIALEAHLKAAGLWPPKQKPKGE